MINECMMAVPHPWWHRFFLPQPPRPRIDDDPRTYLTTEMHVRLDWRDRLRMLVSGHFHMTVVTYTDSEVMSAQSVSCGYVVPNIGRATE